MEDYREAQRAKWRAQKEATDTEKAAASAAAEPAGSSERAVGSALGSAARAASSEAGATTASPHSPRNARRVHILPVHPCAVEQDQRLSVLSPSLRKLRADQVPIKTGMFLRPSGYEFVVVKCEPDEAVLAMNTDYYIEGSPLKRFEKVQFVCLWDFERARTEQDATTLFRDYINPYFREQNSGEATSILALHERLPIQNMEFEVMAAEPIPPEIGIVDLNTVVYVDWDNTPEFSKIHFVPFQDTLPAAYEYDVFNDYLKPYLTRNKLQNFGVNDQFTFQGVQFKVVCCEPRGPARIGKSTTIFCEGVLHPSLGNLLPPEMIEQLQALPPGLQMMLLNTEAIAGGYQDRLIEVQDILSRQHGMQREHIDRIPVQRWNPEADQNGQTTCMVCLNPFEAGHEVRQLPCHHVFHVQCIDEWLRRCTDCPICKTNVDRAVRQY